MNRRDALKRTAMITGYALSAPVMASILQGCQAEPTLPDWQPEFLTKEQGQVVMAVTDLILPKTETPSGTEVGVPSFVDQSIKLIMTAEDQKIMTDGLDSLDAFAKDKYGKAFISLTKEEQYEVLNRMDEEAKLLAESIEQMPADQEKPDGHYFLNLKGLIIGGYFSSEEVATHVLNYDPIPGEYRGCIPYSEVGATWADL